MKSCNANRHRYIRWDEVKDAIRKYYGNHYKPDGAFNKMSDFKQTSSIQQYLNDIDRLNIYAQITDYYLINIMVNSITPHLYQAMAYNKDLRATQRSARP